MSKDNIFLNEINTFVLIYITFKITIAELCDKCIISLNLQKLWSNNWRLITSKAIICFSKSAKTYKDCRLSLQNIFKKCYFIKNYNLPLFNNNFAREIIKNKSFCLIYTYQILILFPSFINFTLAIIELDDNRHNVIPKIQTIIVYKFFKLDFS